MHNPRNILLLYLVLSFQVQARSPDLCAGYDVPDAIGETDGYMFHGCFAQISSGYMLGSNSYSTLMSGTTYGTPTFINFDEDMQETTIKLLVATGLTDFSRFEGCDGDYDNDKVALMTEGDHYVVFYSEGVTPNIFTLNYAGSAYSDYGQAHLGMGKGLDYKDGILFLWITHDTRVVGNQLFKIRDTGVLDFVFQEVEGTNYHYNGCNVVVDWDNEFVLTSSTNLPWWTYVQQAALYDFSGTPANLWLYAETTNWAVYHLFGAYNDFLYFQCGVDVWYTYLQFVALKLNSVAPYNIINYGMTWLDSDSYNHNTCDGVHVAENDVVYVLTRHDDGTLWTFVIDYASSTHTVQRFDGNFRNGGYDNSVFGTSIWGTNAVLNPEDIWYMSYNGIYAGSKVYSYHHVTVMAVDDALNCCQDIMSIADGYDILPYDDPVWWNSVPYTDWLGTFDVNDVSGSWSLGTAGTVTLGDLHNEMSEFKVCEQVEAMSNLIDASYPEQMVQTHTHIAYTLLQTDCPTSSATITYFPVQTDDSPLPSGFSYDSTTRTFTTAYLTENTTFDIKIRATVNNLLTYDEDKDFTFTLTQFNYAPTLTPLVDQTCDGFSVCTYQPTIADIDPTDTHAWTLRYQVDPVFDPLTVWVVSTDPSSFAAIDAVTGLITFTFADNTHADIPYVVEVTAEDSDSDAHGITNTVSDTFDLTIVEYIAPVEETAAPIWLTPFNFQYFMDVGFKFLFYLPAYSAPGVNDIPTEITLTWRNGSDDMPLPNVAKDFDFSSQPMKIEFIADEVTDIGHYEFDLVLQFYDYGATGTRPTLSASFTLVVSDFPKCAKAYYPDDNIVYVYEGLHKIKVLNLKDEFPCKNLQFRFAYLDGTPLPEWFSSDQSTFLYESTNPASAGEYEIEASMVDQAFGKRPFSRFKVIVKLDFERPSINPYFKLKENEPPLTLTIGEISDSGDVIIESNKALQPIDLAAFTGRSRIFDFSVTLANPDKRRLQLMNSNQISYHEFQTPVSNRTDDEEQEDDMKNDGKNWGNLKKLIQYRALWMNETAIGLVLDYPNLYSISKDGNSMLSAEIIYSHFFVSKEGERLAYFNVPKQNMPLQFERGDKKVLAEVGFFMTIMFYLVAVVTLVLSFFSYSSTQALWIHLATFQYIAHFPLVAHGFPINISYLMSQILDSLNLKFFSMDAVWGVKEKEINILGYSNNFLFSLKASLVIFVYMIAALLVLFGLHKVMLKNVRGLQKPIQLFQRQFFFNLPIRYLMQTFTCFTLAAFYNAKAFNFGSTAAIVGGCVSVFVILVYTSLLFVNIWFLLRSRNKLNRENFVNKVGTLYQEVRTAKLGAILYTEIFLITRYFLAVVIVIFNGAQALKIAPVAFLTTLQAFYTFQCQPFTSRWLNIFDFLNQVTASFLSYMIICFTDYNWNYYSQYKFGKFYISMLLLLFIVNSVFVLFRAIVLFFIDMKKLKQKKNLEAAAKGPDLFDIIGQMSQDWEKSPDKKKKNHNHKSSIASISDANTSQNNSQENQIQETQPLQDSVQRLNQTQDDSQPKNNAGLAFQAKKQSMGQNKQLRATSRASFRQPMPVNPNKSSRRGSLAESLAGALSHTNSVAPILAAKKKKDEDQKSDMDTTRSLGSKQISSVVKIADVNPVKYKKSMADTFGQTLVKRPKHKRQATVVLNETKKEDAQKQSDALDNENGKTKRRKRTKKVKESEQD